MMSVEIFRKSFSGYQIQDVAVRNKEVFYFLCRNKKEAEQASAVSAGNVTKRFTSFVIDESEIIVGHWELEGYSYLTLSSFVGPVEKSVCISSQGHVFLAGGGEYGQEDIPMGIEGPRRGAILRARMIGGTVYAVGAYHTVCWRDPVDGWVSLCLNLPLGTPAEHDDEKKSQEMAFNDIDGFDANDLYVVGGRGVVWHCNGKNWRRIPFPSNMLLESVCCGKDGNVYIGAQSGALFCGRRDKWKMIHRGNMSLPFKDIVWHADQLWCTSDYGLWTLKNGEIQAVEGLASEIKVCAGNLSVADGVMLMGGVHGAAFHNGNKWQLIFNQYQMEQLNL